MEQETYLPDKNDLDALTSRPESSSQPNEYVLTPDEKKTMLALAEMVVAEKLQVYALNQQLEDVREKLLVALRRVDAANQVLDGAKTLLERSKGMFGAQASPGYDRIFVRERR